MYTVHCTNNTTNETPKIHNDVTDMSPMNESTNGKNNCSSQLKWMNCNQPPFLQKRNTGNRLL